MRSLALQRLLREWVALLAILAMVLGPLSLAVSRGLSAQERVNIAAGLTALPLCMPGDGADSLAAKTGGVACDHCCLSGAGATPPSIPSLAARMAFAGLLEPAEIDPSALLSQLCLPPATGPPLA